MIRWNAWVLWVRSACLWIPRCWPGVGQLMVKTVALGPACWGFFFRDYPLTNPGIPFICGDPNQQLTIGWVGVGWEVWRLWVTRSRWSLGRGKDGNMVKLVEHQSFGEIFLMKKELPPKWSSRFRSLWIVGIIYPDRLSNKMIQKSIF